MIVGIRPGGHIPFHVDHPAREHALAVELQRFHIVLSTNRQCWNFHDGTWQQLQEGSIYQMDPSCEHASINLGETTRYHLVVDLEKASWRPWTSEKPDVGVLRPASECGEPATPSAERELTWHR